MTDKDEFNFFIDQLHGNAVKEFRETEQYKLLQEKLDKIDCDCETMLTADGKEFAVSCFELLLEAAGQEQLHVYRKGLKDSVRILKWLGVLAWSAYIFLSQSAYIRDVYWFLSSWFVCFCEKTMHFSYLCMYFS